MPWYRHRPDGFLLPGRAAPFWRCRPRLLGFERVDAARFSMLLSIPALLGIIGFHAVELMSQGDGPVTGGAILAAFLGFVAALIAIAVMMAWLKRSTFAPFVIYRIVVGAALLALGYGWGF